MPKYFSIFDWLQLAILTIPAELPVLMSSHSSAKFSSRALDWRLPRELAAALD